MILLLDFGNSRLKWAMVKDGKISSQSAFALECPHTAMIQLFKDAPRPSSIYVSNVNSSEINGQLSDLAQLVWQITPVFVDSTMNAPGLITGYSEPEKLGNDRWCAMVAAVNKAASPIILVDAGTCVTIDAIADGKHKGGLILPGIEANKNAVYQSTRISKTDTLPLVEADFLPVNTQDAIEFGGLMSLCATISHIWDEFRKIEDQRPELILTGGGAYTLSKLLARDCRIEAELVFEGIYLLGSAENCAEQAA